MSVPSIVLDVSGAETTRFQVRLNNGRKVNLEGVVDPMDIGAETLAKALADGRIVEHLVTPGTQINWALAQGTPKDVPSLMISWAEAVGLGKRGLSLLISIMEKPELVESDFQMFYGLDLTEWFKPRPERGLSTRRVVSLLLGLEMRPESLFWSSLGELDPMSKTDILLAQIAGGMSNKVHGFLTAKKDRVNKVEQDAKLERIRNRDRESATTD